jgi:hypothetical protein
LYALRALRQVLVDLWDESLLIVLAGVIGGLLTLFIIPIPYVLSAHYRTTLAISEQRSATFRDWLRWGREDLRFFVRWSLLFFFVAAVLAVNVLFYLQWAAAWSRAVGAVMAGLLLTWFLPQPFVPAFYLQQREPGVRVALRSAAVFMATDTGSLVVFWLCSALLIVPLFYFAWVLLPAVVPVMALFSHRIVRGYVQPRPERDEGEE